MGVSQVMHLHVHWPYMYLLLQVGYVLAVHACIITRELSEFRTSLLGRLKKCMEVIYYNIHVYIIINAPHNPYSMERSFEVNLRLCPNT